MANFDITLDCSEVIANLQKIGTDIRQTVAIQAVTAGATQIGNKARINAPVKTGALRNSAGIFPKEDNSPTKVISTMNDGRAEAEIGFRGLAYARIQEFGGTTGRGGHITGKHYLERAINETQGLVLDAMSDVVKAYLGNN